MDEQTRRLVKAAQAVEQYLNDPLDMTSISVAGNVIVGLSPWNLDQRGFDRAAVLRRQADDLHQQASALERHSVAVREFREALKAIGVDEP